jgi:hypothetical protein
MISTPPSGPRLPAAIPPTWSTVTDCHLSSIKQSSFKIWPSSSLQLLLLPLYILSPREYSSLRLYIDWQTHSATSALTADVCRGCEVNWCSWR